MQSPDSLILVLTSCSVFYQWPANGPTYHKGREHCVGSGVPAQLGPQCRAGVFLRSLGLGRPE